MTTTMMMTTMTTMMMTTTNNKFEAYAKINLFLEVLGKRADGYHALRSLVVPVSLSDTLAIRKSDTMRSSFGFADDLCLKAARVLSGAVGRELGADISGIKRIPAGGGLGGGSSDAAAVLDALDSMYGLGLSRERLAEIAADVGSDVPALVLSRRCGAVLMEGRGEIVTPVEGFPRLHFVLVNPGVFSSTAKVFAKCNFCVTNRPPILYNILNALKKGDLEGVAGSFANDLEAPAVALEPRIGEVLGEVRRAGAVGAAMSGSGSTVFGLARDEAHAKEIASALEGRDLKVWCVHSCPVV